jgi:hypothetical protein
MVNVGKKIKINFEAAKIELIGELFDTQTAKKVWEAMPLSASINTWGEEIYFDIPVTQKLEPNARAKVEVGEIGYWNIGKSMCIFFGRTPASSGDKPVAASPVNIFGKIIGDPKVLKDVSAGDEVIVEQIE